MSTGGWIGVDLDGTLAQYDGWRGVEEIGPPIPAMVARVKAWLAEGREVRIFTARIFLTPRPPGEPDTDWDARQYAQSLAAATIIGWCQKHLGAPLPVTCTKDFSMIELWDDRAVQVVFNTGARVGAQRTVDRLASVPEEAA